MQMLNTDTDTTWQAINRCTFGVNGRSKVHFQWKLKEQWKFKYLSWVLTKSKNNRSASAGCITSVEAHMEVHLACNSQHNLIGIFVKISNQCVLYLKCKEQKCDQLDLVHIKFWRDVFEVLCCWFPNDLQAVLTCVAACRAASVVGEKMGFSSFIVDWSRHSSLHRFCPWWFVLDLLPESHIASSWRLEKHTRCSRICSGWQTQSDYQPR